MKIIDYSDINSLASRFRRKRIKWLVNLVSRVIQKHNLREIQICDIGGTITYWNIFPFQLFRDVLFKIDLINLNYPKYDVDKFGCSKNVIFSKFIGNGCDLKDIPDKKYWISHSNSVIEHVGGWQNIVAFAGEMKRIGQYHFVQTPNFWFFIEPHFLIPFYHFFPRPIRVAIQMHIRGVSDLYLAVCADESVRMLSKKEFRYLFPEERIVIERFMGLPKSLIAVSQCD